MLQCIQCFIIQFTVAEFQIFISPSHDSPLEPWNNGLFDVRLHIAEWPLITFANLGDNRHLQVGVTGARWG